LKKAFQKGHDINWLFTDSGEKLNGVGIEFDRYKYGHIIKIKNDIMYIKMSDGKTAKLKMTDIKKYYLRKFYKKIIKKLKLKDDYFYYLLFNTLLGKDIEEYTPAGFWEKELMNIEVGYFEQKLKSTNAEERDLLTRKFKKLEAFKKALGK
jgi:hypothetical protein